MRAATITGYDGIDEIELRNHPDPTPEAGEAVVRVEAASLNHRDLWSLKPEGTGDPDALPYVPGGDLAGEVIEVGPDASVEAGDRVVLCPLINCGECRYCRNGPENMCKEYQSYDGGFAEQALVRADRLVPLPDSVSYDQAAALPIAYMTAYRMLKRGGAAAGDCVFVPGATGGVGAAAVQLGDVLGTETIGTSSSAEKLDRVERAADLDHAIHTSDTDEMEAAVADVGPVDVTINHVGGPFTGVGLAVLRRDGAMVMCGSTAGGEPTFDARDLYFNHKRILGSTLGTQPDLEELVAFVADGRLDPLIGDTYPLSETADAFRAMADREAVGKLIVHPQA